MWIEAELVFRNFKPLRIEPGMLFLNILHKGTRKETIEVFRLDKYPVIDDDEFIKQNGYPVEMAIVDEEGQPIAFPEEIGWWDEGDDSDELYDIGLKEINTIIQEYDGYVMIDIEEVHMDDDESPDETFFEIVPILYSGKVTLRYPFEEEFEFEDDDEDDEEEEEEQQNETL